jgi:hypothetical protein
MMCCNQTSDFIVTLFGSFSQSRGAKRTLDVFIWVPYSIVNRKTPDSINSSPKTASLYIGLGLSCGRRSRANLFSMVCIGVLCANCGILIFCFHCCSSGRRIFDRTADECPIKFWLEDAVLLIESIIDQFQIPQRCDVLFSIIMRTIHIAVAEGMQAEVPHLKRNFGTLDHSCRNRKDDSDGDRESL